MNNNCNIIFIWKVKYWIWKGEWLIKKDRKLLIKTVSIILIITIVIIRFFQYKNMYSNLPLSTINDIAIILLVIATFLR